MKIDDTFVPSASVPTAELGRVVLERWIDLCTRMPLAYRLTSAPSVRSRERGQVERLYWTIQSPWARSAAVSGVAALPSHNREDRKTTLGNEG